MQTIKQCKTCNQSVEVKQLKSKSRTEPVFPPYTFLWPLSKSQPFKHRKGAWNVWVPAKPQPMPLLKVRRMDCLEDWEILGVVKPAKAFVWSDAHAKLLWHPHCCLAACLQGSFEIPSAHMSRPSNAYNFIIGYLGLARTQYMGRSLLTLQGKVIQFQGSQNMHHGWEMQLLQCSSWLHR